MLAMSDQNGEVHASIPGLARIAGIDIPSAEKALTAFLSPDPYSRTPDNEGRRIVKIDGGWELLNHAKYRKMASKEDSKAATAERVRRHRERNADVTPCNAPVTPCNGDVTVRRDIAEAEAEVDKKKRRESLSLPFVSDKFKEAWNEWVNYRKTIKKKMTEMTMIKQLSTLSKMGEPASIAAINQSIEKGWTGLFEAKNEPSKAKGSLLDGFGV